jgi:hypothetical protein
VQQRMGDRSALMEKEARLAEINARIAELDKEIGNEAEWDIAAKRAELGDMSAYDNIVSRRANAAGGAISPIEEILYRAKGIASGLKSPSTEEKLLALDNIEVALEKAEKMAQRSGEKLPSLYYELKDRLANMEGGGTGTNKTAREIGTEFWIRARRGKLSDSDINAAEDIIEADPNSELSQELKDIVSEYEKKTPEYKKRQEQKLAARKKMAKEAAEEFGTSGTPEEKKSRWNALLQKENKTPKDKAFIEFYEPNDYGNPVPRGGKK